MAFFLIIYTIIIIITIFKGFYKSKSFIKVRPFSIKKNTEFLVMSIQIESLSFFKKKKDINLFIFFFNFIFISLMSFTLLPNLIFNHTAFCMDNNFFSSNSSLSESSGEESNETRSSIDSGELSSIGVQEELETFIMPESSILENLENEFQIMFKKNIKHVGYLSSASKDSGTTFNFKIFKEINQDISEICYKNVDIFKTISYKNNINILNIEIIDFINILDILNFNCHKMRFLFLKSYFELIQNEIEQDRTENWIKILKKIPVFQTKLSNTNLTNLIFDFVFDKGVCNYFTNVLKFCNYLDFLIDKNTSYIEMLKKIDNQESLLKDVAFVKKVSFNYIKDNSKKNTEDLLSSFIFSSYYLSENSSNEIPFEELLQGETHYLFENKLKFLSYFKEHRRSENELLTNNDVSISERNTAISKNTVFYTKKDIKPYFVENIFNIEKSLSGIKLTFSDYFEKNDTTEEEEKTNTTSFELEKKEKADNPSLKRKQNYFLEENKIKNQKIESSPNSSPIFFKDISKK